MANPLTGDFEAVLQVSGATVNRLLASMHQNAGTNPDKPSFPHSIRIRVGDPHAIDGMRGTIAAQVSVPRIELIHGAEDRFYLEADIRARYSKDAGTTPVPEFIRGKVRALYVLEPIDPQCWGWAKHASEYLWIRVVGDSVTFTGTAFDDLDGLSIVPVVDEATATARITHLLRVLLRTRFEATPQKASRRFRRGTMRSLHVGMNRTAVAIPVALTGDPLGGRLDSINQDLLEGRDFGLAISRDVILSRIQAALDTIKAEFGITFSFHYRAYVDLGPFGDADLIDVNISWRITLTGASADWAGGTFPFFSVSGGVITIKLSGQARTQKSMFDWDFDVTQFVLLTFDAGTERFAASAVGSAIVNIGGPFGAIVEGYAKPEIQKQVGAQVQAAAGQLANELTLSNRKDDLIAELQKLDGLANARFDEAVFTSDGAIVRGRISLSPRRAPVASFAKTPEADGFSAFESWVPGGRIDAFDWSWTWFNNAGEPGHETDADRFVLRRPYGKSGGRFGAARALKQPLPGIDGGGRVCVNVQGVHVHPVTGDLVPVSTGRRCTRFGIDLRFGIPGVDRVFLRDWGPGPHDPAGPIEEVAIFEVGGQIMEGARANTLVVFAGESWSNETAASLREGLVASRRIDAGLLVLVLFRDGVLRRAGPRLLSELREFAGSVEAPVIVNEDVRGSWSNALSFVSAEGEPEWRLISPTGGVTWSHTGVVSPRDLAGALDDFLFPSQPPGVGSGSPRVSVGSRLSAAALGVSLRDLEFDNPCPPPPIGRAGVTSVVAFVHAGSSASETAIRNLVGDYESADEQPVVSVVVDGASATDIERLKSQLHEDFVAIPDPEGAIARQAGVRVWPTTIVVNETGLVTRLDIGADPGDRRSSEKAS